MMVYKNGFKEFFIVGCACGAAYGLVMGLIYQSLELGVLSGVLFGVLYAVFIAIFSRSVEKKSESTRAMIASSRQIICEGPANHKKGINAIGGWLFLTEDALAFYPHKMNFGGEIIVVYLSDIVSVETKGNQLIIASRYGYLPFIVNKANLWRNSILGMLQGAPRYY